MMRDIAAEVNVPPYSPVKMISKQWGWLTGSIPRQAAIIPGRSSPPEAFARDAGVV